METIIWQFGAKCEKTPKEKKPIVNANNEIIHNIACRGEYTIRKEERYNEDKQNEIMKREMVPRTCLNPFLTKDFNTVIAEQSKYLIPKNSLISD
jgi:hypothetical protein